MRVRKDKSKSSISKQLTKSYLFLFPFFIISLCIVAIVGSLISHSWLSSSLSTHHQYNVEELLRDNINEIDISEIIKHGGGGAIVYEDGTIKELGGQNVFSTTSLSKKDWTEFLTEVSNPSNKKMYSIAYDEVNNIWLVISVPVSIHFYLSFTGNMESPEFTTALIFYISLLLTLLLMILLFLWFYAKLYSKSFILPLKQLCDMVNNIKQGKYEVESNQNLTGEFLWLSKDIFSLASELKQEKTLRENIENDKRQILLDISHDLRNPLATIMGYAETLSTIKTLDPDKKSNYAEVIFRNSVRANGLINDLFTYTKLDSSNFAPLLEKNDICEFTREQVSLFLTQFEVMGIKTQFEIPEMEIFLLFDKKLLARVFSNLFNNCIEHNKSGIKFTLTISEQNDFIQIVFADNGIGMNEILSETIFDPFVRADKSRNSRTGGSGLGLAIVQKIIQAHHGSIKLDTLPNKGCIFTIKLNK